MTGFHPESPNVARVYETLIGGKDNFEPDRGAAAELAAITPQIAKVAGENKDFQVRAVRWLAEQGITQFADLGCGMPAEPNTHESARDICPDARIAYVDNDPVVVNHMNTFARPGNGITAFRGDVGDPGAVRAALDGVLDLTRPVAVLMCAVLHFYDAATARELIAAHTGGLAPGSYLAVSVIGTEGTLSDQFVRAYSAAVAPVFAYSDADLAGLLSSFDLVPPGVTTQDAWRPGWAEKPAGSGRDFLGHVAVARVPAD